MTGRPLTLADVLEVVADAVPARTAVATLDRDHTYAELDERATRFARHLRSVGVQPGEHVAIHSPNRIEWLEAFYGCLKARAVPINVNFKYLAEELAHVYTDADCVAAVVAPEHVDAVRALDLPLLRHVLVLGDEYDAALAAAGAERLGWEEIGRSADDHYVLYTGGTTGKPKGVVWRQEDLIKAALNASRYGAPIASVEQLGGEAAGSENPIVLLACGPMMHGGSQWIAGNAHVAGGAIALYDRPTFDPAQVLDLVVRAKVLSMAILGDAMGRPIAEAIAAEPDRWDLSGLLAVSNGAAPLSEAVREQLRAVLPGRFIVDTFGSSESGATASRLDDGSSAGGTAPRFDASPDVEVFDALMQPCPVGVEGLLGRTGPIPLGYWKDEAKTAATFRVVDGVRWSIPGDAARREEDGSITLLGRGSVCINTGGEKVHPEEVEAVLLRHPAVFDVAVVGTPHERWGEQVTALVHARDDVAVTEEELREHVRGLLAAYKVPKQVHLVERVPRTAVSKVDYRASAALASRLGGTVPA